MRCYIRILFASLLAAIMALPAFGEAPSRSVKVYFRVGHRVFDPALRDNRAAMDSFINVVREAQAVNNIESLVVSGYASPDGTKKANLRLARLRCNTIASYVSEHTGVNRDSITTIPGGIAWEELRRMVEDDHNVPSRNKIIDILDNTPEWVFDAQGNIIDGRKAQLMSLDRGVPYRWLMNHIFPELRNSVAIAVYLKSDNVQPADTIETASEPSPETKTETDTVPSDVVPTLPDISEEIIQAGEENRSDLTTNDGIAAATRPNRYFAVKTNMLFDAALVPNIGVEVYAGKNISVFGDWMYGWWDRDARHRYWRIYGGELGARWWFGSKAEAKPLTGHHVGIYAGVLTFDFECGGTGYMGGKPGGTLWDRCLVNSGFEYGYSLPVSSRLNIDFTIGLGLLAGNYIKYFPFDNDYYREKEYKMRFFGPTKAEISLVWLLGHGNTNSRKGGEK